MNTSALWNISQDKSFLRSKLFFFHIQIGMFLSPVEAFIGRQTEEPDRQRKTSGLGRQKQHQLTDKGSYELPKVYNDFIYQEVNI